jgi:ribosomal protein S18 acetylase RimI-like enzyme
MGAAIIIRAAVLEELPQCASFWLEMFKEIRMLTEPDLPRDWRDRFIDYFSRRITAGEARYIIALDERRVVATAGAMLEDGYPTAIHGLAFGYIFGVRVEPQYRNRGIATALMRETITFLRDLQCRRIRLHASVFGRRIYEELGFTATNEMELRQ